MYPLKFHREAEAEYLEALVYLEAKAPGLGERFEEAVQEGLEKLASNPQLYSFTERNFRQLILKKFSYVITFQFNEPEQYVYVGAIFHTSREPRLKFREPG